MGMNLGNSSGDADVMVDMNTTPLIDVMLVLLVMPDHHDSNSVALSQHEYATAARTSRWVEPETVELTLTNSVVHWKWSYHREPRRAEAKMAAAAAQQTQPEIHLRPNKLAKVQDRRLCHGCLATRRSGQDGHPQSRAIPVKRYAVEHDAKKLEESAQYAWITPINPQIRASGRSRSRPYSLCMLFIIYALVTGLARRAHGRIRSRWRRRS